MSKVLNIVSGFVFAASIAACGGGGSAPMSNISGSVVKGPVNGATVTFKKADGTKLGESKTSATGIYSFDTDYQGDITIEATGGTYTDEATTQTKSLNDTLVTVVKTSGNQVVGMVTPFTTMAVKYGTKAGKLPNASALAQVADQLATQLGSQGVNLITTAPQFGASANAYGKMLQAFSGYLNTSGALNMGQLFKNELTPTQISSFNNFYANAYQTANGQAITVTLNPDGFTISGTGIGGGSGTCRVAFSGSLAGGIPFSAGTCLKGLPASCDALTPDQIDQIRAGYAQAGITNLTYQTSATCQADDVVVNYAP